MSVVFGHSASKCYDLRKTGSLKYIKVRMQCTFNSSLTFSSSYPHPSLSSSS